VLWGILLTDFRIELLSGFRVIIGGRVIALKAWSQRKPAALVKMLALGPGHRLRREQVMDAPVGAQAFALAGAHALAEAAVRFAASFQGSSAWSAMAQSAAHSAALADGDLVTARLRFRSAADLYARVGHSFWVDWASTQVKTVSPAT
jgi:hypothetical protein